MRHIDATEKYFNQQNTSKMIVLKRNSAKVQRFYLANIFIEVQFDFSWLRLAPPRLNQVVALLLDAAGSAPQLDTLASASHIVSSSLGDK